MRRRLLVLCVVALSLLGAGCEQLVAPPGAAPLRYRDLVFAAATQTSDVTYGTAVDQEGNNVTLRLDVYRPTGDTVTQRPLVVWVHGGGFSGGNKSSPEIVDQATTFARQGYVTASISYRLSENGCSAGRVTLECLTAILQAWEDAKSAVSYLRSNAETYGVDASRIAIAGTSAGAITAANVAFTSADDPASEVRAASLSPARTSSPPPHRAMRPFCSSTAPPTSSCPMPGRRTP